jgi:hypothetical protein
MARCSRYNIMFFSDLQHVSGFLWVSSTNKTDNHDIIEILLKVALNTITLTPHKCWLHWQFLRQCCLHMVIFFFHCILYINVTVKMRSCSLNNISNILTHIYIYIYIFLILGTIHTNITCDSCLENDVHGIRWKCCDCNDYDLCNPCYMNDKHDLKHAFVRIDTPVSTAWVQHSGTFFKYTQDATS